VGKKEKHCDPDEPADARQGDNWDQVALDPEHRLVVRVVPGKRTEDKVHALVRDCQRRTGGRIMNRMRRSTRSGRTAAWSRSRREWYLGQWQRYWRRWLCRW
jgi:hypothetical protein